ncbi:hypothetical protein ROG8370_01097 [Roseovarius gaetbuli]|uniref:DUF2254 domain-containing protein n=1 Tax=Roseovarius gaetbuli TaxID=1356575 RepID=A0A1X6YSZ1_9RHOB|nr:DUF2254 domain-containing protein [Roseovarius gaetbuli]SLN28484.1 hypothetical protein ROG8370_01097 [Roseovarius gaetbuli]
MKLQLLSTTGMTLLRMSRKLWIRVALMALLAVLASAIAILFESYIPIGLQNRFTSNSVMPILTILASGMLAVSTFSLNVMVTAHNAAAGQATPRVHRILLADTTTHTVLATFIGAFVYSLSAMILFKAGFYPEGASVLVLGFTVAVVVLVILALLRWIHHLSDLGSMDATLASTEEITRACLMRTRRLPSLGAQRLTRDMVLPSEAEPLASRATGYVQFIDLRAISDKLTSDQIRVYLYVRPGDYVIKGQVIGHATGLGEMAETLITKSLTIGRYRTFEQDASYGLLVLSETASRALSPGINDPGTAIAVICRQEKLLLDWAHGTPDSDTPLFPRLFLPDVSRRALIENTFASTARDGAGLIEVAERLQDALSTLAEGPEPELAGAARDLAARALEYADLALPLESEKKRLRDRSDNPSPWP